MVSYVKKAVLQVESEKKGRNKSVHIRGGEAPTGEMIGMKINWEERPE